MFYTELARVYGIGFARANYLCSLVGVSHINRVGDLNNYYFELLAALIKLYYGTDMFLLRMEDNKLREFLAFKSYKAVRFSAGLPIRGQGTHTNARTAKALKKDLKYRY